MQVARPHGDPPISMPFVQSVKHMTTTRSSNSNSDASAISNRQIQQNPAIRHIICMHLASASPSSQGCQTLPGGPDYSCIVPTAPASRTLVCIVQSSPSSAYSSASHGEPRIRAGRANGQVSKRQAGRPAGWTGGSRRWYLRLKALGVDIRPVCSSLSACEAQNVAWDSACSL
jgi:hypothetical protein